MHSTADETISRSNFIEGVEKNAPVHVRLLYCPPALTIKTANPAPRETRPQVVVAAAAAAAAAVASIILQRPRLQPLLPSGNFPAWLGLPEQP